MQRVAITLIFCLLVFSLTAQELSNLRTKTIAINSDTTVFDTLPVTDFHILEPKETDSSKYSLIAIHATLITTMRGSITICYRVLFYPFPKTISHKNTNIIRSNKGSSGNDFVYIPPNKSNTTDDEASLNKSGVISRGITVGNNQDLVLNSIFNLQLSGKLNSEWNILGSVSDDNTQLQPDGNTLQLQEFDKIYIKLYNANKQINAGDFELKPELSQSYFLHYYKRNRGVYYTAKEIIDSLQQLNYGVSVAAAKGRYARQVINVIDGNQGPYRLKGNNGELYVLVNSGSERVYLDDKLLVRGYDNDYIIDYNIGEVSFTSKHLITRNSRVIVEFQYSDRNYARTVSNAFAEWHQQKLNIRLHYFSEKDLKNQPVLLDLSDEQKQQLAAVGDSVNQAFSSSVKTVQRFTNEKILYRKVDTLGFAGVYVLATGNTNDTIFYEIAFNEVGANKGHYRLINSSLNGKVYEFIPPVNGILQGNAEPLQQLTAPEGLQNISLGADYTLNKHEKITIELAGSNYNRNEFSRKDKSDDKGYAAHALWEQAFNLNNKPKPLELLTNASFDYVNKNFKSVERFRDVNFTRTWNRQLQPVADATSQAMEHLTMVGIQLRQTAEKSFQISMQQYFRDQEQHGNLYRSDLHFRHRKTTLNANAEIMKNNLMLIKSTNNNFNSLLQLQQQLSTPLLVGAEVKQENSTFKIPNNDTLQIQSYNYNQALVFGLWQQNNNRLRLEASRRNDATPLGTGFKETYSTNLLGANGLLQGSNQTLQFQVQYKTIEVHNAALTNLKNDATITFQAQHNAQLWKNALQQNLQCNAGSGQEQRRIYVYVEVPAGRGTYAWRDYNQDGIKQLNEFEQAYNPDEAKYVRTLVPTTDYTKVNYFAVYENLILQPYKFWNQSRGLKKVLSRFENRFSYKNEFKQFAQNRYFVSALLPTETDTSLISNNYVLENNLIFNRPFNAFEIRYNVRKSGNASLLTYGLERRLKAEQEIVLRYSFNPGTFLQLYYLNGSKQLNSQYFSTRDYHFNYSSLEPKMNFEIKRALRITLRAKYYEAKDGINDSISTKNSEAGLDLHWYLSTKSFMDARCSMVNIKFTGNQNTTVAYEMLQGLNNGNNVIVFLTFMHQVSTSMQINLNYNGRLSQGKPMIHTGGVEVRYLF